MEIRVHGPGQEPTAARGHDAHARERLRARGRASASPKGSSTRAADLDTVAYCLAGEGEQEYNVVTVELRQPVDLAGHERNFVGERELRAVRQDDARPGRAALRAGRRGPGGRAVGARDAPGPAARRADRVRRAPVGCTPPRASRPTASSRRCAKTSGVTTPLDKLIGHARARAAAAARRRRAAGLGAGQLRDRAEGRRRRASRSCARCRRRRAWRSTRRPQFGQTLVGFLAGRPGERLHASRARRPRPLASQADGTQASRQGSRRPSARGAHLWVGFKPYGVGETKPNHYKEIVNTVWDNRAQPAVRVADPEQGRVRRVRARCRRVPRLDDQRRAPVHDAAQPPEVSTR